jgi:hypothetical protein
MNTLRTFGSWLTLAVVTGCGTLLADEGGQNGDDERQVRHQRFVEMLTGVKLVGKFTIAGKEDQASEEEYTIRKVEKAEMGDYWLFWTRLELAGKDREVPLPLEVKWAGDTPMITLTDLKILDQGPFSARVLLYDGKYAGTWSHGDVSGHLYGKIVKLDEPAPEDKP